MMNRHIMHPRDQIVTIMKRIYGYGMTTTSGGNLSILDDNGDLWISPGGVDKGSLRREDVVCVKPDGSVEGIHRPSLELPFHRAIYEVRPDVRAILHAHPPALVTFSLVRKIPDTSILPKARQICGEVGYAPYACPGSRELGENIAAVFAEGHNTVLLENHGVAICGGHLFEAFMRFETLDFCARLIIKAGSLGSAKSLSEEQLSMSKGDRHLLPENDAVPHSSAELELRRQMIEMIHRAYDQMLITSTEGTFSVRVDDSAYLITPYGFDRRYMSEGDLVLIRDGRREQGKVPSRSVLLHERIYTMHPEINAVVIAHPPNIMAFGVSHTPFSTLIIPENYVLLRDVPSLPFGYQYNEVDSVAKLLSESNPAVIIENDCVITTGGSLVQAFDRLEVAEFGANAVLSAQHIGNPVMIEDEEKRELERRFFS